jgi:hypothetical protein
MNYIYDGEALGEIGFACLVHVLGIDMVWALEFIENWALDYRTDAEFAALAILLGAGSVEVRRERTGYNLFLIARKPS